MDLFRTILAKLWGLIWWRREPKPKYRHHEEVESVDVEEFIRFAGDSMPEGAEPPEEPTFDLMKAIGDYMDGLDAPHKSQVQALIGETCTVVHREDRGIPLKVRYANGDEVNVRLSQRHMLPPELLAAATD
jgi:hypothetical protein